MPDRLVRCTLIALIAVISISGGAGGDVPERWPLSIQSLTSPAGPGSAQPQLTVSSRGVLLSWIERSGNLASLKFAERTRAGWSAPRTVASGPDWFVNWADVPSVLTLADGTLAAHWLQKSGPGTYAYDVRLAYSTDDGRTWSEPFTPHHDGTETEHGFASLFRMPGAGLGLIWLDGRATQARKEPGAMSVRFASFDRDWSQSAEITIDARVCECCPTAAAVTGDGVIAAFRDRGGDELRNIHVARYESGRWTESLPVHDDGWRVPACPVNGPALSADGRRVAIAWFTAGGDQGRAFVAFSADAGRSFGPPIRLDDAVSLGRVGVQLLPDGSAAASWIEFASGGSTFRVRRVEPSGRRSVSRAVTGISAGRSSGYPRIALHRGELVFAWTGAGPAEGAAGPVVRTAAATLP